MVSQLTGGPKPNNKTAKLASQVVGGTNTNNKKAKFAEMVSQLTGPKKKNESESTDENQLKIKKVLKKVENKKKVENFLKRSSEAKTTNDQKSIMNEILVAINRQNRMEHIEKSTKDVNVKKMISAKNSEAAEQKEPLKRNTSELSKALKNLREARLSYMNKNESNALFNKLNKTNIKAIKELTEKLKGVKEYRASQKNRPSLEEMQKNILKYINENPKTGKPEQSEGMSNNERNEIIQEALGKGNINQKEIQRVLNGYEDKKRMPYRQMKQFMKTGKIGKSIEPAIVGSKEITSARGFEPKNTGGLSIKEVEKIQETLEKPPRRLPPMIKAAIAAATATKKNAVANIKQATSKNNINKAVENLKKSQPNPNIVKRVELIKALRTFGEPMPSPNTIKGEMSNLLAEIDEAMKNGTLPKSGILKNNPLFKASLKLTPVNRKSFVALLNKASNEDKKTLRSTTNALTVNTLHSFLNSTANTKGKTIKSLLESTMKSVPMGGRAAENTAKKSTNVKLGVTERRAAAVNTYAQLPKKEKFEASLPSELGSTKGTTRGSTLKSTKYSTLSSSLMSLNKTGTFMVQQRNRNQKIKNWVKQHPVKIGKALKNPNTFNNIIPVFSNYKGETITTNNLKRIYKNPVSFLETIGYERPLTHMKSNKSIVNLLLKKNPLTLANPPSKNVIKSILDIKNSKSNTNIDEIVRKLKSSGHKGIFKKNNIRRILKPTQENIKRQAAAGRNGGREAMAAFGKKKLNVSIV
jgi:hypothetical protein